MLNDCERRKTGMPKLIFAVENSEQIGRSAEGSKTICRKRNMKNEQNRKLSFFQKLFTAIFPQSWAESMEADSRRWFMKCLECGFEQSYWEMGGIRWKATGNQRNYQRCRNCGVRSWHQSYYKNEPESAQRSD